MQASPGHRLHHTCVPKLLQVTTRGTPGPHRSHKRVIPQFLLTHAKGVFFTHAKDPTQVFQKGLSLNMIFNVKALLEKRRQSLEESQGDLSILLLSYY